MGSESDEQQNMLLQLNHASNDVNSNSSYHVSNLSSPSGTYKNIPKTPKTFPRTKITSKTSVPQRVALQSLRQHMSFTNGDEVQTFILTFLLLASSNSFTILSFLLQISSDRNSLNFEVNGAVEHQMNGATTDLVILYADYVDYVFLLVFQCYRILIIHY